MDWKQKLTSRKFWAAIAGFVSMLVIALGVSQETATQVTALIMAGASVIAYIIGEGLVDANAGGSLGEIVETTTVTKFDDGSETTTISKYKGNEQYAQDYEPPDGATMDNG